MIAPLIPYALRGVIWYQGEQNNGSGTEYRELFARLIVEWRRQWAQGDFPFLFVQLPSNGADSAPVAAGGWPLIREAQLMTLKISHTGMAVTLDIGNPKDVHPQNKVHVGHRLALAARRVAYGESLVASGPLYESCSFFPGQVRLNFRETGSGLVPGDSPWHPAGYSPFPADRLIGFYVAGADRKWVEAEAQLEGDTVVVSSPLVPSPAAVRYGWAQSPRANLYNREGLPASPFRTDDWP
jgi:sialate O-acetylesterase